MAPDDVVWLRRLGRVPRVLPKTLIPLIGRQQPLDALLRRFESARAGTSQTVLIEAAPGVGKSRLLEALKNEVSPSAPEWWRAGCSPDAGDTALFPLIELVETAMGLAHDASAESKRERVREWLKQYGLAFAEPVALLGRLLGLTAQNPHLGVRITPQREKAQILELLRAVLYQASADRPLVLAFEDLHWIDPSTIEFIRPLVENPQPSQLLVLLTFRPSFANLWSRAGHVEHVVLDHLAPLEAAKLAEHAAGRALPAEVVTRVVEKTDGVPLLVEELTRGVVESGQLAIEDGRYVLSGPLSDLDIPGTLRDSLMARLDRMHDLKEVAQLASVLGGEFSFELMAESFPAIADLGARLERLVEAGLLVQDGTTAAARYAFRHALLRDAAYDSLLQSERRQHHERVAEALERRFGALIDTRPELAAHHHTEAGLVERAVYRWQQAANIALARSANLEAINHLNKALALLERLPAGIDRARQELALQTSVAAALNTTRGYASPDVERAFARARALCDVLADARERFWNGRAQWAFHVGRGDLRTSGDLSERLLRVATAENDPTLLIEAHYALGSVRFWTGDLSAALEHFEQGIRSRSLTDRVALRYTGQHTGVLLFAHLSRLRWLQGFPDDARRRSNEALALAHEISHPLSLTMALFLSLWVHQFLGEIDEVRERARQVIARSREQGLFYESLSHLFIGWASVGAAAADTPGAQGIARCDAGIQLIRQCLDLNGASGVRLAHTYYLSLLLDTCVRCGRVDDGRRVLTEAFQTVDCTGERFWLAELHRLAGELELAAGDARPHRDAATASFRRALEIARRQGARSLEARAEQSLADLEIGKRTPRA